MERMNRKLFVIMLCAAMMPGIGIAANRGHGNGESNHGQDVGESREHRGRGDDRDREDDHDRRDDRDRADDRADNRQRAEDNRRALVTLTSRDREIVRDFLNKHSNLPPGLAKRGDNLPPGLQKQLKRNGVLPPGLQKRLGPVPQDLQKSLPLLPTGYRWGTIGQDVVIVDNHTHRIIDIIREIASRR